MLQHHSVAESASRPAGGSSLEGAEFGASKLCQGEPFEVFGVRMTAPSAEDALQTLCDVASRNHEKMVQLAFINADCLNQAYSDWQYKAALSQCDLVWPDGTGVAMAATKLGYSRPENVNGTDLFPLLCAESARSDDGPTLYLLGGKPGVAVRCADAMAARFPGVRIVGASDGYFKERSEAEVLADIEGLRPDILLVGMGAPQQELWIERNRDSIKARVAMGVGGLFDFYSGDVRRAPVFIRERGFEWAWRLAMEPRRLFKRYIVGTPLFLSRLRREAQRRTKRMSVPTLRKRPARNGRGRRQLDILVSGLALVGLAPILALAAIAIKLDSRGPVFFVQERIGKGAVPFKLWKLRTMSTDAEARRDALLAENEMEGGVLFKMQHDPRVTRVGTFLRKYSIDELPQLWNILRGEMAVVGPRPPLASEVRVYDCAAYERLRVKPGLTGLWQISGRSSLPFAEQVKLDVENVARRSEAFDARVMMRTIPAVLKGSGAW